MRETIEITVEDGTRMSAYAAHPKASAHGGALVLQEAFGVNAHIRDVANRLADAGYRAIAPDLYHRTAPGFEGDYNNFSAARPHLQALTGEGLNHDLRAAHAWLRQAGVERIVAVGFCMGGRAAVRGACILPLAAAASFYGSGIPALRSELGNLHGRLLLFWGDRDKNIPPEQRREVKDSLRAEKKSFVECTFSDAGHGFFCDQRPAYHRSSAQLAWALLLPFLAE